MPSLIRSCCRKRAPAVSLPGGLDVSMRRYETSASSASRSTGSPEPAAARRHRTGASTQKQSARMTSVRSESMRPFLTIVRAYLPERHAVGIGKEHSVTVDDVAIEIREWALGRIGLDDPVFPSGDNRVYLRLRRGAAIRLVRICLIRSSPSIDCRHHT